MISPHSSSTVKTGGVDMFGSTWEPCLLIEDDRKVRDLMERVKDLIGKVRG
jgi:hypothetical protein